MNMNKIRYNYKIILGGNAIPKIISIFHRARGLG